MSIYFHISNSITLRLEWIVKMLIKVSNDAVRKRNLISKLGFLTEPQAYNTCVEGGVWGARVVCVYFSPFLPLVSARWWKFKASWPSCWTVNLTVRAWLLVKAGPWSFQFFRVKPICVCSAFMCTAHSKFVQLKITCPPLQPTRDGLTTGNMVQTHR